MRNTKTTALCVIIGLTPLLSGSFEAFAQGKTNEALQTPTAKLQALEQKAQDRDALAQKCQALEKEISELKQTLNETSTQLDEYQAKDGTAKIQDLERKAIGYAAMQSTIKKKDKAIAELMIQIEDMQKRNQELQDEVDGLQAQNGEMRLKMGELEKSQKSLQQTLEQFWLGNYEYYEVRKGDTLESIASLPNYYNDASKHVWIEQANLGHVKNMTNLSPGEVLIIPRFPPSGRYDF